MKRGSESTQKIMVGTAYKSRGLKIHFISKKERNENVVEHKIQHRLTDENLNLENEEGYVFNVSEMDMEARIKRSFLYGTSNKFRETKKVHIGVSHTSYGVKTEPLRKSKQRGHLLTVENDDLIRMS